MTVTATATPAQVDAARSLVMSRVRAASAGVREAQAAVGIASDHLAAEVGEARRAGVPWDEICMVTKLSRHEAMNLLSAHRTTEEAPAPEDEDPDDGRLLMSVQEYAKHAGISEMTVYKRVREGRLMYTHNLSGRKRIIVAAGPQPADAEGAGGSSE